MPTKFIYVFISSPIAQCAKEAQMKARVSRLGQSRPTNILHFIVEDTIEENIYKLGRKQNEQMDPALSLSAGALEWSREEMDTLLRDELNRKHSA